MRPDWPESNSDSRAGLQVSNHTKGYPWGEMKGELEDIDSAHGIKGSAHGIKGWPKTYVLRQGLGWTVSEVPLSCKTLRLFLIVRREDKLHLPIFSSGFREPQSSTWFQLSRVYVTVVNTHIDPRWVGTRLMNEIPNKGLFSQSYGFSSSHVWIWELDHKEGWAPKNWRYWTVVLEKTLLRVPWTARRSNQSILKEINPEYSLEGLMLKLQHSGHLMWRPDSLEMTLMLGKIEGRRRKGQQRMRWLEVITDSMDMSLSKHQEMAKDGEA